MPDGRGPWDRDEPEPPRARPPRLAWRWIVLLGGAGVLIWLLARAFPGAVQSTDDWARVAQGVGVLAVVSAGFLTARTVNWGQKARHAAIWIGILAVLFVAAAYRDELEDIGRRLQGELSGAYPVAAGPREVVVSRDDSGGFFLMGRINGQPVRFLVDTGSSDTVLSPADAHRLGLDAGPLHFDRLAETANGTGYGAQVTVGSLAVGPIELRDLPVLVNQAPMSSSLLGMSFLGRLESFQVRGRRLYLKARG